MQQYIQNEDIVFIDTEVSIRDKRVADIGAVRAQVPVCSIDGLKFHSNSLADFTRFINDSMYVCGHNIIDFDVRYIMPQLEHAGVHYVIDTLLWSALLFPKKPYHRLLKDDKLQTEELNNPLNDAIKSMELFLDEVSEFETLDSDIKSIYYTLLGKVPGFWGFFRYVNYNSASSDVSRLIHTVFRGRICEHADINLIVADNPVELAYCLATIYTGDRESIIPYWVQMKYPKVQEIYNILCGTPCKEKCAYCRGIFDIHTQLKQLFGYDEYRTYGGEPLQERAVQAAVDGKSLLAIFPTGGGKSITFQIPALIAAQAIHGLTVVISPLQSLMKDQVDNLSNRGITDAVTINGLLNAVERVENGIASILYISPESLRSKTIERLLLGRNIARFVIDEAHCFSAWGQDFRVDYQYIGDFIKYIQEKKNKRIPVSCFTATAKQKVISDIREYFKQKLDIDMELYTTNATRTNLRYEVIYREDKLEKYATLRSLIEQKKCPTIVYASRTATTEELALKLTKDGFNAKAFNGKMDRDDKIANQDSFIRGDTQIIVATSAFGMGVDKKDVKLVIHYDISDSLENYVQEAGRAGRDQSIDAECYVLFNENDLDKHFILLNQTKLSISEIQQTWRAIKNLTRDRRRVTCSALEIARQAGWDDSSSDIETKVKTAILALENAGYVERGQNCPRVYADSLCVKNADEAVRRINSSNLYTEQQREYAIRIVKKLISTRSRAKAGNDDAESRVDYIADHLGINKGSVIEVIEIMKDDGILANGKEMYAYVERSALRGKVKSQMIKRFADLEGFLINHLTDEGIRINYKEINEEAIDSGIKTSTVNNLRILLYFWIIKGYVKKPEGEINQAIFLKPLEKVQAIKERYEKRLRLTGYIEQLFIQKAMDKADISDEKSSIMISFSLVDIKNSYNAMPKLMPEEVTLGEVAEALLYICKINAFRIEGGFLVLYNAMSINRLEMDNKIRYKNEDYRKLKEYYELKTQQIHIVGEFANMMVKDYDSALTFVNDYFSMEYKLFITKYFKGSRAGEIERNITPMKYRMLFENLSKRQAEIIEDDTSPSIVVAAGPGSGKTKILVHKLASLMLLEDVKHEQLLLLTFSRAAAMEFKSRLIELIGNAAYFVEIKTFHSYCFDLLGKIGSLKNSENVVRDATDMILSGEVELDRITKTVLVIDEAQDMDNDEYALVKALMERNEDMRVIAVGDDDQNIYEFRAADSKYMEALLNVEGSKMYELVQNFRSNKKIVETSNAFVKLISKRMKHNDITPVRTEEGNVQFISSTSYLEQAVINKIELDRMQGRLKPGKTVAVLTNTNEQAYIVVELLLKKGFRARLIQGNDGFSLYDLAELRFFTDVLKSFGVPAVSDDMWNNAKQRMVDMYGRSHNISSCIYMLEQFEKVSKKKYCTDVESFLKESRFEDFYRADKDEISVSTIHKSKGREFDNVYMLVNKTARFDDERKRSIYVGMTRAKDNLFVFYNSHIFDEIAYKLSRSGVTFLNDNNIYAEPEEIIVTMSYGDVYLGFFSKGKCQERIAALRAGDSLAVKANGQGKYFRVNFYAAYDGKEQQVAMCSGNFADKLQKQYQKGYVLHSARVNYVVRWWNKEEEKEYTIVLPVIRLRKRK